jgi:hypothetical protein
MNTDNEQKRFNILSIIKQNEEWVDFVKNFDEANGFMWTRNKNYFEIHEKINDDTISPMHFALYMRSCQHILNA